MLNLTYSNDPGKLVESLIINSPALGIRGTDLLFSPPVIILPNRNLKTWLYFELSRRTGIAANIRFLYLEEFLQSILTDNGRAGTIITRNIIHSALIALLQKVMRQGYPAGFPTEITAYLSSHQSPDEADLRMYQLSSQLSRVFEEYFLSRDSMLKKWMRGDFVVNSGSFSSTERWQRHIWEQLFAKQGSLTNAKDKNGRQLITYSAALDALNDRNIELLGEYHLFGFSYMSRGYLMVLDKLVRTQDINCYSLNPCQEFWEDIASQSEKYREQARRVKVNKKVNENELEGKEDPFELDDDSETPALRLWGRPGREHNHILNSLTDCDFSEAFEDPLTRGRTVLHQLQHDILFREAERTMPSVGGYLPADESIRFIACPGVQREVEIVANEIWSLVMKDEERATEDGGPPLRFNDIAVIIANSAEYDTYRTHIASVFREIHDIPHSVSDASVVKDAKTAEAVQLLLDLPLSSFRREDVLRFITHPSVVARFPEADAEQWIFWVENTGIFHGRDHLAHADTYIEKDLYNWEQGIKRLSLGAFMSGLRSGNESLFPSGGSGAAHSYLPEEFGLGSMPNAGLAVSILTSVIEDCRYAAAQEMTFGQWSAFLHAFITSYIGADSEDDEQALTNCIEVIENLKKREIDDTRISYRVIREFIRAELTGLTGNRGHYLARGVSVSSFLPMRPIPFRVVFVLGLGEGKFPARDMRNPLDLRGARRMAGDVTARERDQYMFLETLVSTRERLYLSYVSRNSQTGDMIEPSSVVKELMFMLERGYVGKEGIEHMKVVHPLRRFDSAYFPAIFESDAIPLPNYSLDARKEAAAAALRESLARAFDGRMPDRETIEQETRKNSSKFKEIRTFLGVSPLAESATCEQEDHLRISLRDVRKFLECPLQGWATFQLGLREEDSEDPIALNEEALETPRLETSVVMTDTFVQSWNMAHAANSFAVTAPEVYEDCTRICEMKGKTPSGYFKAADKLKHLDVLQSWNDHLRANNDIHPANIVYVQFGKGTGHGASISRPAICLRRTPDSEIELCGRSGLLSENLDAAYVLYNKDASKFTTKRLLQPFLDMVCLSALGVLTQDVFAVHALCCDKLKTFQIRVPSKDDSLNYLQTIVSDLTQNTHAYLLPVDVVLDWHNKGREKSLEVMITDSIGDDGRYDRQGNSCSYGSIRAQDYRPLWKKQSEELAERRLGLFLESLIVEKKEPKQTKKGSKS